MNANSGFEDALKAGASTRFARRGFLKGLLAGGAGTAVYAKFVPGARLGWGVAKAAEYKDYKSGKWIPSCCNMCGGQCGINVYVDNGVVLKIDPLATNPNNVANVNAAAPYDFFDQAVKAGDLGRLCCKGNSGIRNIYDPDRLKTPLRRTGPRGSGQFEPITWEEAIAAAAKNLKTINAKYGAASLVWFGEDHSFTHAQANFCDAFGTPNYSNHSNLCDTGRKAVFKSTIGNDRPLGDFESADLCLIWGWNFLSALKWIHLAAIFSRGAKKPGFKFIYVDPVFNTTASKADVWVPIKPGTDGALALAICRHIVKSGKYDTAFVTKYTFGFDDFVNYLDGDGAYDAVVKDSAWAEKITGVPAAQIDAVATDLETAFAAGKKILIDAWSGPGHHTNATQGGRAIVAINLLLGAVDKAGSLVFPRRSSPPNPKPGSDKWPKKDKWRADGRDDVTINNVKYTRKYLYSHGSGIYVEMIGRMLEQKDFLGNPYPIKACVIVFQNLLMSTPNTQRNIDALNQMDFVLCVDSHLSETAMMADIVIPGSSYLERFDFNANWSTFQSLGLRQPVVKSWIGGRSEAQFFLDLGAYMGLAGFGLPGKTDVDENLNKLEWETFVAGVNNKMTWDELKAKGVWIETGANSGTKFDTVKKALTFDDTLVTLKSTATPPAADVQVPKHKLKEYKAGAQSVFTVVQIDPGATVENQKYNAVGIVVDPTKIANGTLPKDTPFEAGFGTTTRYGQFWDPVLADAWNGTTKPAGQDVSNKAEYHPLPFYLDPIDKPDSTYPLSFVSWKEVEHTHTRTFNNPWLMSFRGENRLYVHPDDAKAYGGIEEGDRIMVETADGMVEARAHVAPIIMKGVVGWVRGFGHWALGKLAKGKGSHDGWLLKGRAEIHSGQAVHKEAACRIYKVA